jgi:hypothetical protein
MTVNIAEIKALCYEGRWSGEEGRGGGKRIDLVPLEDVEFVGLIL